MLILCGKGLEFTQSHRPEVVIPDSYDKCEPGLNPSKKSVI